MKNNEFNWLTRLTELSKHRDGYCPRDLDELRILSGDWPTCACGQLCSALPRRADQSPMDSNLFSLGLEFFDHVENQAWKRALKTFKAIEARTTELLIDMGILNKEKPFCVEFDKRSKPVVVPQLQKH